MNDLTRRQANDLTRRQAKALGALLGKLDEENPNLGGLGSDGLDRLFLQTVMLPKHRKLFRAMMGNIWLAQGLAASTKLDVMTYYRDQLYSLEN